MSPIQGAAVIQTVQSIPWTVAFVQGLLSFFSPCVLPLLPVYLSLLAGGTRTRDEAGEVIWPRRRVLVNTLFFSLGICAALLLLSAAFVTLGSFFRSHRRAVNLISGGLVIIFGLIQLGVLGKGSLMQREYRLQLRWDRLRMSPLTALLMGLCFSFSWTPCIGPTLTGILMMTAAAASRSEGMLLMGGYMMGFVIPFLAVGLFTGTLLTLFRKHRAVVRWTGIVSGALMILMGVMIMTDTMGNLSAWIASATAEDAGAETEEAGEAPESIAVGETDAAAAEPENAGTEPEDVGAEPEETETMLAPDFTLRDQFGTEHTLSDYRGKTVLLNFWATWCPWCMKEMPDLEKLYHELGENKEDTVILGIASPGVVDHVDESGVIAFLEEQGITYPVLMDDTGLYFYIYGANSLPTSWTIHADGSPYFQIPGAIEMEMMREAIEQTRAAEPPTAGETAGK